MSRPGTAVIPAAGLGMRFLPLSRVVAKELLPLGRRPLIHHALAETERAGFTHALVVVSPGKHALRDYFAPAPALEAELAERGLADALAGLREAVGLAGRLRLRFVEQPAPAGLGDAVRLAGTACEPPFAVLLPDDVITGAGHWARLLELHAGTGRPCLCVRPVPAGDAHRFGIAVCAPRAGGGLTVERLVEKPPPGQAPSDLAVLGRYVVTADVLDELERASRAGDRPAGELQLTDALAALVAAGRPVLAVPFAGDHYDSGTPADYAAAAARYALSGR